MICSKRLGQLALGLLVLMAGSASLPAVDLIYVSTTDDTIVTYDISLGNASAVAASLQTFVNTNLNAPYGLAFDSSGNLYVPNGGNDTISKFDSAGVYQSNITTNLNTPTNLAFDTSGNLYAANTGDNTISKFDSAGNFVFSWSTGGATPRFLAFAPAIVPEPSTYALCIIASGVLAAVARRRKQVGASPLKLDR